MQLNHPPSGSLIPRVALAACMVAWMASIGGAGEAPERREKGAYLGVSTSSCVAALRRQLALPDGVGLVVEFVAADSPAADAGVRQYDVLHRLNDQLLINQQQLAVLVRTFKAGDEVKLTVMREGKSVTLTARLVEKDLPPLDELRIGEVEMGRPFEPAPGPPPNPRTDPAQPPRAGDWLLTDVMILNWNDGEISFTLTARDGRRHLRARDNSGDTLYDGPIDTPEQRDALPKPVRDRLDALRLPPPPPAPTPTTRPTHSGPSPH